MKIDIKDIEQAKKFNSNLETLNSNLDELIGAVSKIKYFKTRYIRIANETTDVINDLKENFDLTKEDIIELYKDKEYDSYVNILKNLTCMSFDIL